MDFCFFCAFYIIKVVHFELGLFAFMTSRVGPWQHLYAKQTMKEAIPQIHTRVTSPKGL